MGIAGGFGSGKMKEYLLADSYFLSEGHSKIIILDWGGRLRGGGAGGSCERTEEKKGMKWPFWVGGRREHNEEPLGS